MAAAGSVESPGGYAGGLAFWRRRGAENGMLGNVMVLDSFYLRFGGEQQECKIGDYFLHKSIFGKIEVAKS